MSSVITISQPSSDAPAEMTFAPMDPDMCLDLEDLDMDEPNKKETELLESTDDDELSKRRQESLDKLTEGDQRLAKTHKKGRSEGDRLMVHAQESFSKQARKRKMESYPLEAIIVLKEERAYIFHEFLRYIYPQ